VLGQAGKTGHVDDRKVKVCDYLTKRLGWREAESEAGDGLKPSTLAAEREAIELYFKPGIGHIKLVDLRDEHIRDLYAAMRLLNRPGEDDHPSELLRRLREARASRDGHRVSTRPLSEARIKRMHAVLTGALNEAVKVSKILAVNPADGILRAKGGGRKGLFAVEGVALVGWSPGWRSLGVVVVGQRFEPDRAVLACRVVKPMIGAAAVAARESRGHDAHLLSDRGPHLPGVGLRNHPST
jgi:hypothetical protein